MGLDTMVDMQLHLDVHDQVNVTWGLVIHIELALHSGSLILNAGFIR